jgi:hypothetical protein
MALAHSKTYNFKHTVRPYDGTANNTIHEEHSFGIKDALVSAGWTVIGSHDGNGDLSNDGITSPLSAGTDHWTSAADVFNSGSNKYWIVLQSPAAMGTIHVLLNNHHGATNPHIAMYTSAAGQFLTANGGTNGTTTVLPTAPDSVTQFTASLPLPTSVSRSFESHAAWSTDGTQFFLFSTYGEELSMFLSFCKLDNYPAALQNGMVWYCQSVPSAQGVDPDKSEMSNSEHYTSSQWSCVLDSTNRKLYVGGRGWNNAGIQSQARILGDNKASIGPCEAYSSVGGVQGYIGTFPDMYWSPINHFNSGFGDTVGGPIKWYSGGGLIIPWDSNQSLPRRY